MYFEAEKFEKNHGKHFKNFYPSEKFLFFYYYFVQNPNIWRTFVLLVHSTLNKVENTYLGDFKNRTHIRLIYRLIKPWPNTYAFTKAIAEDVVRFKGANLPVVVVRPAIGIVLVLDFVSYSRKTPKVTCFFSIGFQLLQLQTNP